MSSVIKPNLIIPGAGKSGTSFLAACLGLHPDIFMPAIKEPAIFSTYISPYSGRVGRYEEGWVAAQKNFIGYNGERFICDASTVYMYDPESPKIISKHVPDVRLIFVLRNPVDRLYSNYWQDIKAGYSHPVFSEFIRNDCVRFNEMFMIGEYDKHIERWFDCFHKDNILFIKYDDLKNSPIESLRCCLNFLGLKTDGDLIIRSRINAAALPRSRWIARVLRWDAGIQWVKRYIPAKFVPTASRVLSKVRRFNEKHIKYQEMNRQDRVFLLEKYMLSIGRTAELTGLNIDKWKI